MPIMNYPAHSRYILPYVEKVREEFTTIGTSEAKIPIFSSFSCKPLTDPEEMRNEFLLSIAQTIHWHQAVSALVREHGVTRFVNIGPCRSLSRMMGDLYDAAPVVEASELLGC